MDTAMASAVQTTRDESGIIGSVYAAARRTTMFVSGRAMTRLSLAAARGLLIAVVVASVHGSTGGSSSRQDRPTSTGGISGIVVDANGSRPIGGVTVTLHRVPDGPTVFPLENSGHVVITGFDESRGPVLTGADGRFSFAGVPQGVFEVSAHKLGRIGTHPARPWSALSALIALADGQRVSGVSLSMLKAPVVSGRVLGERDQPLTGVPVSLFKDGSTAGHPVMEAVPGSAWTDDRGMYVLPAMPGNYMVATTIPLSTLGRETPRAADARGRTLVYQTTFYRQARSTRDALRIALRGGDDIADLNIHMTAEEASNVTGVVTGGEGLKDLEISLVRSDRDDVRGEATSVYGDNRGFRFPGIPTGTYRLRALQVPQMPSQTHGTPPLTSLPPKPTLWADTPAVVTNRDVDVPLQLREGVRIHGRVEFDGATPPPALEILNRRALILERADGEYADLRGLYLPDGRFTTMQIPPGRYLVAPFAPQGWHLKSVLAGGRDVADVPLEVRSADVSDLVITFTDRPSRLTGRVIFDRPDQPQRAWVTIFPVDRALWTDHGRSPRTISTIWTGVSGEYVAELPAGRYFVIATEEALGDVRTPAVFHTLAAWASTVTLTDRSTTTANVRVQRILR
jgi:hypothetical protein